MFDALGFRGVWKRHKADEVVGKLKRLQSEAVEFADKMFGSKEFIDSGKSLLTDVKATLLSDTVVFGLGVGHSGGRTGSVHAFMDALTVGFMTRLVAQFLYSAARDSPVLAYRGVVSFGDFVVDDRFVVGEAIDDAAEHMGLADAGVVWLTPLALDAVGETSEGLFAAGHEKAAVPWRVPLAGGSALNTWAVNPFWERPVQDDGLAWTRRLLASFTGPSARVRVLRQNTESFLAEARKHRVVPPEPGTMRVVGDSDFGKPAKPKRKRPTKPGSR